MGEAQHRVGICDTAPPTQFPIHEDTMDTAEVGQSAC